MWADVIVVVAAGGPGRDRMEGGAQRGGNTVKAAKRKGERTLLSSSCFRTYFRQKFGDAISYS